MSDFDIQQLVSAFIVLFAVIDILGATPVIIDLRGKGRPVNALKATLISFALMLAFFYVGDGILRLFRVDIESFAVAGSILLFLISLEMLLDIEIFKSNAPLQSATLIPLVFPLLAGAGTFTTLLSLRAEYAACNILLALALNMACVYCVIRSTDRIEYLLGKAGIYLVRKFFGIILMAISVKLFTTNIVHLLSSLWG